MNKIGIIAAMDEEMEAIKNKMNSIKESKLYNLDFYEGNINNKAYVLVKCGIGKVNAARTTQIMIDNYNLKYIINVGSAGAINDKLDVGDIIIGKKIVQHDFDLTAFGNEKGYISETGKFFESDEIIIKKIEVIIEELINKEKENKYKIVTGNIATGDVFCNNIEMKEQIRKEFNAECVEMEGAAIAQVCFLDNIPFIVIRSISDSPNGKNEIDFNKYLKFASQRCAEIIEKI